MADERNLASDITTYYSRLNNIRSKFGLSKISVPEFTPEQTTVLSSQIKSYDKSMSDTASERAQYISKSLSTGNLEAGSPTLRVTDVNIKQMLSTWESTCYHRSDYSDRGNDGDYSVRTDYTDNDKHENERTNDGGYRAVCGAYLDYTTDNTDKDYR